MAASTAAPLVARDAASSAPPPRRRLRPVALLCGAVAGACAVAATRGARATASTTLAATSTMDGATSTADDIPSLSGSLRVIASNEEYGRNNVTQYPFLFRKDAAVAEPHRLTTFSAEPAAGAGSEFVWYLDDEELGHGGAVTTVFTATGTRALKVEYVSNGKIAGELVVDVYVKYVRRELRTLSAEDRKRWLRAAATLWRVDTLDGRAAYGPRYVDIHHLAIIHNDLAGNNYCDFIHGATGYAFVNAHAALGAMLEQAMQTVEPAVALPYWDYTLDEWLYADRGRGGVKLANSKDLLDLWKSPLWSHEFFGASDAFSGEILDGAWSGYRVPVLSEALYARAGLAGHFSNHSYASCYGQSAGVCPEQTISGLRADGDSQRHMGNSFGLLRSPWNMRAAPTITRSRKMCGSANNAQFPDCTSYMTQQAAYADFADYVVNLQVSPHGTVHVWSGGAFGTCSAAYDALEPVVVDGDYLAQIKSKSSDLQKNLWMDSLKTCPARGDCLGLSQDECVCSCGAYLDDLAGAAEANVTSSLLWTMFLEIVFDGSSFEDAAKQSFNDMNSDDKLRILATACDNDVLTGDMLGSNSPLDVSFFATHAEVERVWQRYALSGNMTNATWPVPGLDSSVCPGQHPDYRLAWFRYDLDDGSPSYDLTNVMWRDLLNPANPSYPTHIPYVFDNFDWTHCYDHYTNSNMPTIDASLMRPADWVWFKDGTFDDYE